MLWVNRICRTIRRFLLPIRYWKKLSGKKFVLYLSGEDHLFLARNSEMQLGGPFLLGQNRIEKNGRSSILRMDEDSRLVTKGSFSFCYGADVILFKGSVLTLGDNSFINSDCRVRCHSSITIGSNCVISHGFTVMDSDAHKINGSTNTKPVVIEDHVWIGTNVTVLSGVTIGQGAVIAAGAVVTTDIPSGTLAGGVPARILRNEVEWQP